MMSIPNLEELFAFKKCVRKYARVKMRCITYYQRQLINTGSDPLEAPIKIPGPEAAELSEAEHFATYFSDRRPVDGNRVREYLIQRYEWLPGMKELCTELQSAGVPLAAMSNYPAPWAPLVEDAVGLSQLVPWAFVSGDFGLRKPSPEAYLAALKAVGREAGEVVFVDDSQTNVDAAQALGITSIRFESAAALRPELQRTGVLR